MCRVSWRSRERTIIGTIAVCVLTFRDEDVRWCHPRGAISQSKEWGSCKPHYSNPATNGSNGRALAATSSSEPLNVPCDDQRLERQLSEGFLREEEREAPRVSRAGKCILEEIVYPKEKNMVGINRVKVNLNCRGVKSSREYATKNILCNIDIVALQETRLVPHEASVPDTL